MISTAITNEDYHADRTHYSSSALKLYLKDPREFHKQYILNEKPDIPDALQNAFDFGSYIHTHILEPHLLEEEYAIFESGCREAFEYDHKGKTIITAGQDHIARKMIESFNNTVFYPDGKPIKKFFQRGKAEESMFGEIDGVKVKIRTDFRKQTKSFASINDVKTTKKKVTLANIKKTCEDYDYDLSAALYVDVVEQVTGVRHDFYFLFMGKTDYKCRIVRASEEFLERGREKYKRAIKGIKKSIETGVWIPEV